MPFAAPPPVGQARAQRRCTRAFRTREKEDPWRVLRSLSPKPSSTTARSAPAPSGSRPAGSRSRPAAPSRPTWTRTPCSCPPPPPGSPRARVSTSSPRPSTDAILTCRLIDRPLRPTFTKGLRNEVQVVITVLALNPDHQYDVLAINAASASTQISGLPFSGPIGGVRVSLIDGEWVAFPNFSDIERSVFDMVVAGRIAGDDVAIMMVVAESTESTWDLVKSEGKQAPTEEVVSEGLEASKKFIKVLCEAQAELAAKAAKPVQDFPIFLDYQDDVYAAVEGAVSDDTSAALTIAGKQEREERLD